MASVNVQLNHAAIDRYLRRPGGPVYDKLQEVIHKTETIATVKAPVDTGLLRNSRTSSITDIGTALVGRITYHADYAIYVMKGTGLFGDNHSLIRPKHAKFMRFRLPDGTIVLARTTKGQRPQPFLVNALKAASPWPVIVH